MSKATLSLDHGDDVKAAKVNLQPLVHIRGNCLGWTPRSISYLQSYPATHTHRNEWLEESMNQSIYKLINAFTMNNGSLQAIIIMTITNVEENTFQINS